MITMTTGRAVPAGIGGVSALMPGKERPITGKHVEMARYIRELVKKAGVRSFRQAAEMSGVDHVTFIKAADGYRREPLTMVAIAEGLGGDTAKMLRLSEHPLLPGMETDQAGGPPEARDIAPGRRYYLRSSSRDFVWDERIEQLLNLYLDAQEQGAEVGGKGN